MGDMDPWADMDPLADLDPLVSADPMAVIMDSVAETRDRLNRLRDTGSCEPATSPKPPSRKCQHGRVARTCEICDRDRKIEGLDRLCRRQSTILTGVAIAIRGEPGEAVSWSHHDLVERVQAAVDELEALREERGALVQRLADLNTASVNTANQKETQPKASYLPGTQGQLLALAAHLGKFKARGKSGGIARPGPRLGGRNGSQP
jgi:hypothetical protein